MTNTTTDTRIDALFGDLYPGNEAGEFDHLDNVVEDKEVDLEGELYLLKDAVPFTNSETYGLYQLSIMKDGKRYAIAEGIRPKDTSSIAAEIIENHSLLSENKRLREVNTVLLDALKYVMEVIEESSEWWMTCQSKGGFDTDKIESAIEQANNSLTNKQG